MQIGRQTLETFSAHCWPLDRLPADVSPSRLMSEGLAGLRSLVPFDAAWWGECSGGMDGLAPRNWLSGRINLSADFAREWNRISASDRFASESMQRLDTVVCEVGYADPEPAVEAFSRRHDLYHVMAITRALTGSGLLQFVSLYRHRASPPFEPAHRVLFEQFSAHLMQRWSARIAALVGDGGSAGRRAWAGRWLAATSSTSARASRSCCASAIRSGTARGCRPIWRSPRAGRRHAEARRAPARRPSRAAIWCC